MVTPADTGPREVLGAKLRVVEVDLGDERTLLDIGLANGAEKPDNAGKGVGDDEFHAMVGRTRPAVAINGTFFSEKAGRRVMGDMIRAGELVKYSPWEDAGTTFILHTGNRPEMVTERAEGAPDRSSHWLSLTGGPRLLRDGKTYLHPREEGFRDPAVFRKATRTALGFTRDGGKLLLVSFVTPVGLEQEAEVMKSLGTYQAMNLDGGTSSALAVDGRTLVAPGRRLTNILAVYDAAHPAPERVAGAWQGFARRHPRAILATAQEPRAGDRWLGKLAPGQSLAYAGLKFKPKAGAPVVGVLGDRLAFSEGSFGQIYAAYPAPRRSFHLEFEARVLDERLGVDLGPDLVLEARRAAPTGLFLKKAGTPIARASWSADRHWHRFTVTGDGKRLRVQVDGAKKAVLEAPAPASMPGLGLSGRGEYRAIKLGLPPRRL